MKKFTMTFRTEDGRSRTYSYADVPTYEDIPTSIRSSYVNAIAEAQMLEQAIEKAIHKDVLAFAEENREDLIELLELCTLGRSIKIIQKESKNTKDKVIADCIGFFRYVQMGISKGPSEQNLDEVLNEVVERRNFIAHEFYPDFFDKARDEVERVQYLKDSERLFIYFRTAIIQADHLSSKLGAVGLDGKSVSRLPPNLE